MTNAFANVKKRKKGVDFNSLGESPVEEENVANETIPNEPSAPRKPKNAKSAYAFWKEENYSVILDKGTSLKQYYKKFVSPDSKKKYEDLSAFDKQNSMEQRAEYNRTQKNTAEGAKG
jgi:hypothetical protein